MTCAKMNVSSEKIDSVYQSLDIYIICIMIYHIIYISRKQVVCGIEMELSEVNLILSPAFIEITSQEK